MRVPGYAVSLPCANITGASVSGIDDRYAIWPYGKRYTADPGMGAQMTKDYGASQDSTFHWCFLGGKQESPKEKPNQKDKKAKKSS